MEALARFFLELALPAAPSTLVPQWLEGSTAIRSGLRFGVEACGGLPAAVNA